MLKLWYLLSAVREKKKTIFIKEKKKLENIKNMARITSNISKCNKYRWVILHKWQSLNFVEKYIKSQQYIVYKK